MQVRFTLQIGHGIIKSGPFQRLVVHTHYSGGLSQAYSPICEQNGLSIRRLVMVEEGSARVWEIPFKLSISCGKWNRVATPHRVEQDAIELRQEIGDLYEEIAGTGSRPGTVSRTLVVNFSLSLGMSCKYGHRLVDFEQINLCQLQALLIYKHATWDSSRRLEDIVPFRP